MNSFNILPLMTVFVFFYGDTLNSFKDEKLYASEFIICLTLWCLITSLLNYTTNLCSMKNSPLSVGITHSFKVF